MSSGVQVSEDAINTFRDMKDKHLHSYVILKINEKGDQIVLDEKGPKDDETSHEVLCRKLQEAAENKQGRYALFDCIYDKNKTSKLCLITWVDDAMVKIKDKMLYTSSKKQLQSKMEGIAVNLQCNSIEDLEWAAIVSKCASKYD
ncbi:uncharacterized protein LOC127853024 [Dreissena polymorpha]|uniref:ADF-H domain-containing protein n=1 Tax=Dreissena polymorpha TaxID=45954 RepID=A0A9D4CIT1_DREPO|nr:uncharacterized protein LOC127853024 [Dreissena polymorpha]XP_052243111.1 uncharacterized protein LOC127853024 [Dreissena polymorpha]KAH3725491.1 hypothetical protein DPMN_051335 [Dreissena polymorpha]